MKLIRPETSIVANSYPQQSPMDVAADVISMTWDS